MAIIVLTLAVSSVFAQGTPRLSINIEEEKVNLTAAEAGGNTEILYMPGDTIRYALTASNVGDGLMTNAAVVNPVPGGVDYVAGTALGQEAAIVFSIDDGKEYQAWPVTYVTRNARGEEVTVEATADMITHVKWNIQRSLQPGESVELEFKVEVE